MVEEFIELNLEAILHRILKGYPLDPNGVHGMSHWARVYETGQRLAAGLNEDLEVAALFALFHDSRRVNERIDYGHGQRGADFAATLRGSLIHLSDDRFERLYFACVHHTDGMTEADPIIQICWDSDRLDLARVGVFPSPWLLCTEAAKKPEMMEWANRRALQRECVPAYHQWAEKLGEFKISE